MGLRIPKLNTDLTDEEIIQQSIADSQLPQEPLPEMTVPLMSDQDVINQTIDDTQLQEPLPPLSLSQPKQTSKISPSSQPGKTAALETALASEKVSPAPAKEDEASLLMGEYRKTRKDIEKEQAGLEEERARGEAGRQLQTGIAGALQSFGQGLAAITGGTAKPLETGVATLRSIGEQEAAAEERKAKTLKERLQMAKAPLEEKQMEMELRSRLTKGQLEKDLMDPLSAQSQRARKNAESFVDNMIAQATGNKAPSQTIERLNQVKSMIGNMSAAQVQDFYNTLKPLSTETSIEAKNKFELDKLAAQERMRLKLSEAKDAKDQESLALKDFVKIRTKVADEETAASKVGPEMIKFSEDLDKAIRGDKTAAKRVAQNFGAINYLNARTYESKGVFTDNDLRALSQLEAGRTWFQQLDDFVTKGMTGNIPKESLLRVKSVMDNNINKFTQPGKYIRENYAQTFEDTGVPAYAKYADTLRKGIKNIAPAKQPETVVQPSEKVYFMVAGTKRGYDPVKDAELIKKARDAGYQEVK
jgi:hypothetical protein